MTMQAFISLTSAPGGFEVCAPSAARSLPDLGRKQEGRIARFAQRQALRAGLQLKYCPEGTQR